MIKTKLHKCFY